MSFAALANDTTRAQINNIPSKSHVIPLLLKHAASLNLEQAALLKIMLRVLVLIMQHALHAYIHFPHTFLLTRNSKNTTISIFNTKKIRNLQLPSLITDVNFRLSSGNNNIFAGFHLCFNSLRLSSKLLIFFLI